MRKTIQLLITISTFIGCIIAILSFINQIKPINPDAADMSPMASADFQSCPQSKKF
jgi:hypothetical protein